MAGIPSQLRQMKLINLTGRPFSLHDRNGVLVEFAADPRYVGLVAVGDHQAVEDDAGHTFSLTTRRIRGIKGMPEPDAGTIYVVPVEVAMALQEDRDDVAYLAEDSDGTRHTVSHLRRTVRARTMEL